MKRPGIIALLLVSALAPAARALASDYQVIVNAKSPVESVDRKFIADAFLKKITHWPDDGIIHPVDLKADSPVRRKFSEEVLDRSVMGVKSYWQQLIFSGSDVPPLELPSDGAVLRYVSETPGAVGYVSATAVSEAPDGVRAVNLR